MKIWVFVAVLLNIEAAMSFQRAAQTCHPFSATFIAIMDQNIDNPSATLAQHATRSVMEDWLSHSQVTSSYMAVMEELVDCQLM